MARRILLLIAATLVVVGVWLMTRRPLSRRVPAPLPIAQQPGASTPLAPAAPTPARVAPPPPTLTAVPIQDGKTIDFSSGQAVVKDDVKEKAALDRAVAEIDAATANVTFDAKPTAPAAPATTLAK
jgi:hypothetical protein